MPEEQLQNRTFCAVCDSQFDIHAELVGWSPFRAARALALIPAVPAPPTRLVVTRGDSPGELVLRSAWPRIHLGMTLSDVLRGAPAMFWLALAMGARFLEQFSNVNPSLILLALVCLVPASWLVGWLVRRETMTTDGATLVVRRGSVATRETRIPFGEIVDVRVETEVDVSSASGASAVLKIVRHGAATVTLGRGFGYDRRVTAWLKAWLDSRLARRAQEPGSGEVAGKLSG